MNSVAGTPNVPIHNTVQSFVEVLTNKVEIASVLRVRADGLEEPERRIAGIEFRSLATVGETIWQHALIPRSDEGDKHFPPGFRPARR